MSKIDYQVLREKAEKATCGEWSLEYGESRFDGDDALIHREAAGYIPICRIEGAHPESGFDEDFQMEQQANAEFIAAANPATVLALLDERERNQQYIKRRDQENEEIALTVGKLRVELEETKSKLNEQREYYEGVISDGGKRIAELEKSEEQLINERDHAESALTDMYFAATGDEPEWSNWFGFSDAVDAVVDRIADLEAKQPSPVVPDNASEPLAYAYKELTPEIMRNHLAVFERYGIAPNDSSTTIQALRIALDGIERSDAMLHGAEPVSQTYKSQHTQFEQVADLYEMQFDDGRTCAFHTDAQKAAQWLQACDGNRVQEYVKLERLQNALSGNSPVTPDGWISCSERMPKKNQNVLISVNFDSDLVEPLICSARYTGSTFRRGEATIKPGNGVEQVTHWMPLPEPPQEVK